MLFGVFFAASIVLIAMGYLTGASIIMIVISGVMYTIWTLCSIYPQWTNLVTKPEDMSEEKLHNDEQSIVLLGKENDFSEMKAAFLPDITISYHYDIFCDDDRLYIFSNIDNTLITLSKENAGGDVS